MKIFSDIAITVVLTLTGFYLYTNYWDNLQHALYGSEPIYTIYIGSKALDVTLADEAKERIAGLSNTPSLGAQSGKLFVFDTDEKQGIWMKDMRYPIDIIWIDSNLKVVDIAENVTQDTYPKVFAPKSDARFVLEVNAYFVSSTKVEIGNTLLLPPGLLPKDIEKNLQK